jgi:hypothetical protein
MILELISIVPESKKMLRNKKHTVMRECHRCTEETKDLLKAGAGVIEPGK